MHELIVVAIIKDDLHFQFVEYEGIKALFSYVCEDTKLVSRNTIMADVLSMYKREKVRLTSLLHSIPRRMSFDIRLLDVHSDGWIYIFNCSLC